MQAILETENLRKQYQNVKAVDGISLRFFPRQVHAILGPNGAGKTTAIEMLVGIRKPDGGTIRFFGQELREVNAAVKERIGVQLQSTSFFQMLTVRETLEAFAGLFQKRANIDELIERFGLAEKAKAPVKSLSGGQVQRLAVACALVNDPELLFLDEPTNHLDPQSRRNIWEEIGRMKKDGKALVLTTHQIEEAEKLADFVTIVDHGKVIASGTVEEIVASARQEQEDTRVTLEDAFLQLTGRSFRD